MANFYIADLHLGHANVIRFDNRPFEDLNQMHEVIIANWNRAVSKKDTVYILGDLIWNGQQEWPIILKQLPGNKVLIRGNHDPKVFQPAVASCFQEIGDYKEIKDNGRSVVMCHYPIPFFRSGFSVNAYMLYGHVHTTIEYDYIQKLREEVLSHDPKGGKPNGNFINVGCMMPWMDYTPRTLDEIISRETEMRQIV